MVTRFRLFTTLSGGCLVTVSFWAFTEYSATQGIRPFAEAALVGVAAALLPFFYIRARRWVAIGDFRFRYWWNTNTSSHGGVFTSNSPVDSEANILDEIIERLPDDDTYDAVRSTQFSETDGVEIVHTGFHKSYIRVTESGTLVVTGTNEQTQKLAARLEDICSITLEPSAVDPFSTPSIRKGPRVLLVVATVVLLLLGIGVIGAGAYPSSAYNPAERTVLVGIDARSDIDPSMSASEASVAKAQFLIQMLDEEAVEIQWDYNSSSQIRHHGKQAIKISSNARKYLSYARMCGYPDEGKLSRLEANLADAEVAVANAIEKKSMSLSGENPRLNRIRSRLLELDHEITENDFESVSTAYQHSTICLTQSISSEDSDFAL
ncbi:hypothetical protein [Halobellus sp. EA9]|uniref:hypothetical protein n=1 Tax=Halobellus sp. EA9 TaxID=3421647 RepID=UPI003EBD520D